MKKHSSKLAILVLSAALAVSGCASKKDTFGARLGEKLIATGEKKIKQGKRLINRGEKQQNQGENMVSRGEEMKLTAKAEYCQLDQYRDPNCS
jgi:outer membrane lipoprotein-sorting protein